LFVGNLGALGGVDGGAPAAPVGGSDLGTPTAPIAGDGGTPAPTDGGVDGGGVIADYVWTKETTGTQADAHLWPSSAQDVYVTPPATHSAGDGHWTVMPNFPEGLAAMAVTGSGAPGHPYVHRLIPGHGQSCEIFHANSDGSWSQVSDGNDVRQIYVAGSVLWIGGAD